MATLYISEYGENGFKQLGGLPLAAEPSLVDQTVAIGAATPSAAFGSSTRVVRVHCDAVCSILFSKAGTAAAITNKRLPADHTEYFAVQPGDKLSVIANT